MIIYGVQLIAVQMSAAMEDGLPRSGKRLVPHPQTNHSLHLSIDGTRYDFKALALFPAVNAASQIYPSRRNKRGLAFHPLF